MHMSLFYKNVYPQKAFVTRNVYNLEVPVSNSKALNKYLESVVD